VRLSGTEAELNAFKYIQAQLESYHIKTELNFIDAYISHPKQAYLKIGDKKFNCITHAMAAPTSSDGIKGELVYVGNAQELNNNQFIQGKVAVVDGLAVPEAVYTAQNNGAIATIFINGAYTHEMIVSKVWG